MRPEGQNLGFRTTQYSAPLLGSTPPETDRACIFAACRVARRPYINFISESLIFGPGAARALPGLHFNRLPR